MNLVIMRISDVLLEEASSAYFYQCFLSLTIYKIMIMGKESIKIPLPSPNVFEK